MTDYNNVGIAGRLTRDAEVRDAGQTSVLDFAIASNRKFGDKEEVTFLDCSMFGDRVTKLAEFLTKGKYVVLGGRLRQESWEKDGVKRTKISLVVSDVSFVPDGKQAEPEVA